jgi:hypothetical protein
VERAVETTEWEAREGWDNLRRAFLLRTTLVGWALGTPLQNLGHILPLQQPSLSTHLLHGHIWL